MRTGGMRHSVEIWGKTSQRNEYGEIQDAWSLLSTIKAQVLKRGGGLTSDNQEVFNSKSIELEVWNHHGIDELKRLKWQGELYSIQNIDTGYDGRKQKITCTRINE